MRKVLSRITPLVLCAILAAESAVFVPSKAYAYDGEAVFFEREETQEEVIEVTDSEEYQDEVVDCDEAATEISSDEEIEVFEDDSEAEEVFDSKTDESGDASSEEIPDEVVEGKCGDNLTYTLTTHIGKDSFGQNKTEIYLNIDGTGDMYNYSEDNPAPWFEQMLKIKTFTFSEGITSIGDYAFHVENNTHVVHYYNEVRLPSTVKRIGKYAFYKMKITHLYLPEVMDSIEERAFDDSDLGEYTTCSVEFPKSIKYIGKWAFQGCKFRDGLVLKDTVEIDDGAFNCATIKGLTLPNSLKRIGRRAFAYGLDSYNYLLIPGSVTEIGDEAFIIMKSDCVEFRGDVPEKLGNGIFGGAGDKKTIRIRYPMEYPAWKEFIESNDNSFWGKSTEYIEYKSNIKVYFHDPYGNVIEQTYTNRSKIVPPDLQLKDGDKLYGWYTQEEYQWEKTRWDFDKYINDDVTLYARLESDDCRVIFETGCDLVVPEQSVPGGSTAVKPETLKRDDKVFVKWVEKDSADKEKAFDFATPLYEDITIVAVWRDPGVVTISGFTRVVKFTGKPITFPDLKVCIDDKELTLNKDYTVEYKRNVNNGLAAVVARLCGDYSGTFSEVFYISSINLNANDENHLVYLKSEECVLKYNGKVQKAKPVIYYETDGERYTLKEGKDYDLVYEGLDKKSDDYYEGAFKSPDYHSIRIVGKGNFHGERYFGEYITKAKDFRKATVKLVGDRSYTGDQVCPKVVVRYGGKLLKEDVDEDGGYVEGADYSVEYENNIICGTATVYVHPTEESGYFGTKVVTFEITGSPISKATISGIEDKIYNGEEQLQEDLYVEYNGEGLNGLEESVYREQYEYTDFSDFSYTYEYQNNVAAGKAKLIINGINAYSGTVTKTFNIQPHSFDEAVSVEVQDKVDYNPKGAIPGIKIICDQKVLTEGKDYTVTLSGNKKVGTAKAKIVGKGGFKGTITKTFEVAPTDISSFDAVVDDVVYKKGAYINQPGIIIYDNAGNKLKVGKDLNKNITYKYVNNTAVKRNKVAIERTAGEAVDKKDCLEAGTELECTISGIAGYTGEVTCRFRVANASIGSAKVKVKDQYYSGRPVKPTKSDIVVKLGKGTLWSDDYDIVGYKNNIKAGTATVTLRGKGNYGGIVTATYNIVPMKIRR